MYDAPQKMLKNRLNSMIVWDFFNAYFMKFAEVLLFQWFDLRLMFSLHAKQCV